MNFHNYHNTYLFLVFFSTLFLLPFSSFSQVNGTVQVGSFMTATEDTTPWLSPSSDFAFGFSQLKDKNLFLLAIWYNKIPDKTIIWYANDGQPVSQRSRLELSAQGGLNLYDPQGRSIWSSVGITEEVAYSFMNDTGNFVLIRTGSSTAVWESFKNPTDTIVSTQIIESDGVLFSKQSENNFSKGHFQLRLLRDGNLVLNIRDIVTNYAYDAYYISGTYDPSNSSNSGFQVIYDSTGYMFIRRRNGQRSDLTPNSLIMPPDSYYRATLGFDGVFTQYHHPKSFTGNPNWTPIWSKPDNICLNINGVKGIGACGYNNVCTLGDNKRPVCECPIGFSLIDPNNTYGSCKPSFTSSCRDEELEVDSLKDVYDFQELLDTDWPTSDYRQLNPSSEQLCRESCLQDCFCAVAIFRVDTCWMKKLPLSNGRKDQNLNGKALIKYRKGSLPPLAPPSTMITNQIQKQGQWTIILVGSVLLGTSFFIIFCLGFFIVYKKKKYIQTTTAETIAGGNQRCFQYRELLEATDGFKEEIGRGAFGTVYKGVMQNTLTRTTIAVKKLDSIVIQDKEKEFRTEVNTISQTYHKNLVRLLGFCDEGQHRMLVYEFMSKGSLASLLFGNEKLSWSLRTEMAIGVARGLVYLHDECITQIIHCDIKPQNILLDENYNARISDFGLAKLLVINQSKTNTGIRGTKGYVAPEWFRNVPISAKVDVYSFGVLLCELITCRRSLEDVMEDKPILTEWVYDCYIERKLESLVRNDEAALVDNKTLKSFVMVAIWCIQEDSSIRPSMRKVSQMLEGIVQVPIPPCPYWSTN
ncbi:G-type lectin S-receptor-like serine/threonine-protein kinase LECRK3 [Impatiens glandulifera]|uniref:G-type lectin S-receptor-like serine/threonine-protein kinase LECRK3 n=1 Tax=Impatiens glandulifera TaxID=253017 RepID=UPI001FB12A79|nr:G-type lectin S-receptor-like serine/threonine-protein kinase LECRK3 [Impatiens glandulifera]